jgi:hypothetical protein
MSNITWQILDVDIQNDQIISAKYQVIASNDTDTVETEGNWYFNTQFTQEFADITEQNVIDLILKESVKDGINIIESRLDEQLSYLSENKIKTPAPWLPQTFTPNS